MQKASSARLRIMNDTPGLMTSASSTRSPIRSCQFSICTIRFVCECRLLLQSAPDMAPHQVVGQNGSLPLMVYYGGPRAGVLLKRRAYSAAVTSRTTESTAHRVWRSKAAGINKTPTAWGQELGAQSLNKTWGSSSMFSSDCLDLPDYGTRSWECWKVLVRCLSA
jgi:hypothetical protein